jgi:hypothetical protein
MRWESAPDALRPRSFVIEQDVKVGFYVYAYEGNRCTHDYLQDTFEQAVGFSERRFGVPHDSWKKTIS